jgi:SIR2 family protein
MEGQGHEEKTGTAKHTHAYNLPCKYILHTVGPVVQGRVTKRDRELLASCYRSCLQLAEEKKLESVVFNVLRTRTTTSTEGFSQIDGNVQTECLKQALQKAEAVIIGAGAGLSTSAGFTYSGERFEKWFGDFRQVHGFSDMYSGGFFPYKTLEEYWAYWSRYIYMQPGRMQFMPA